MSLKYRESGDGDQVVLFVHGFPFDSAMWEPQLGALPDGWRGVAPDLTGFGGSAGRADAIYTMDLFARDLVALLDELEIERAVVCGLSMGGYIAMAMWRLHPGRVRALVLCDTRAGADSEEARRGRGMLAAKVERAGAQAVVEAMLPKLVAARTRGAQPDVVEQVKQMMLGARPESLVRALHGLAARPDSVHTLESVTVPTLVIVGAEDAITPPAESGLIHERVHGSRLVEVAGAGHVSNMENPDEFNTALFGFLEELTATL